MKVLRKTSRYSKDSNFSISKGDIEKISGTPKAFCCKEMKNAWDNKTIFFGEYDSMLNKNGNVNISQCAPYPEGAVWTETAINFCPFCAEKIEIEDIALVRLRKGTTMIVHVSCWNLKCGIVGCGCTLESITIGGSGMCKEGDYE